MLSFNYPAADKLLSMLVDTFFFLSLFAFFFGFSGDCVFAGGAASTPTVLLDAMTEQGKSEKLRGITVCHMHTEGVAGYTEPECAGTLSVWPKHEPHWKHLNYIKNKQDSCFLQERNWKRSTTQ